MRFAAPITIRPTLGVEFIPGDKRQTGYRFDVAAPVLTDAAMPLSARICFAIAAWLRSLVP